jgi:sulfatase maturation enzyme AslB (radical SAM superfamily)
MIDQTLDNLRNKFDVVTVIELDHWHTLHYQQAQAWLIDQLTAIHKPEFQPQERIVIVQRSGDVYVKDTDVGLALRNLQIILNEQNFSNFFIVFVSNNPNLAHELEFIKTISIDPVPITGIYCNDGAYEPKIIDRHPTSNKEIYQYGSVNPLKISLSDLTEREIFLLTESKTFCMYPWIHLHAWPTGQAFPCCMADREGQVGDCRTQTMEQIWNNEPMKKLRRDMLSETPNAACTRCYEQEESGFFSGRKSANKHQGHLVNRVAETQPDGQLDRFEMTYWDIRFSNLCNLRCRSCGYIFSSQWHQDQSKLVGNNWGKENPVLLYAGKHKTDMWEQLIPHLDYVEQIYFAGGEPLLMEEHYNILDELDRRGRHDVRLIYNSNFTEVRLKDRTVFDYWKRFKNVAVGASLDAMGLRGEYIRKGTNWDQVERNREQMLTICPEVDFYVSSTLSIMNALHLPDFHKNWVERGYIKPQDFNINLLQDPDHYRIDILPDTYKKQVQQKYEQHLEWLRPKDRLTRATAGFESAIKFMNNSHEHSQQLMAKFWHKTQELDTLRKENILEIIPEMAEIK